MKKLFLFLILCVCSIYTYATGDGNGETTRRDMQITDVMTPAQPDQLRSLTKYAEGWIDYQAACIEVEINEIIGVAQVVIVDAMGRTVASTTINPAVSTFAILPMPAKGTYTMGIASANYYGECNFTID